MKDQTETCELGLAELETVSAGVTVRHVDEDVIQGKGRGAGTLR